MAAPNKIKQVLPAESKGEQVHRWQKKAADLESIADRRESRDEDCTDLRIISDVLKSCALELAQTKF